MRTYTESPLTLVYPDQFCKAYDYNRCELLCSDRSTWTELTVTIGAKSLSYRSQGGSNIIIDMTTLLRTLDTGAVTFSMMGVRRYTSGGVSYSQTISKTDTLYIVKGRTLADWLSCSGHKVYGLAEIGSVEIPLLAAAYIDGIASPLGINEISMRGGGMVPIRYADDTYHFGSVYDFSEQDTAFDVEMIDCVPTDGCVLEWVDSDGCRRYIVAKIVANETTAESVGFNPSQDQRPTAKRLVTGTRRQITLYLHDVEPSVRLHEVTFSPDIRIGNGTIHGDEAMAVIPAFENIETRRQASNYTLKFLCND